MHGAQKPPKNRARMRSCLWVFVQGCIGEGWCFAIYTGAAQPFKNHQKTLLKYAQGVVGCVWRLPGCGGGCLGFCTTAQNPKHICRNRVSAETGFCWVSAWSDFLRAKNHSMATRLHPPPGRGGGFLGCLGKGGGGGY